MAAADEASARASLAPGRMWAAVRERYGPPEAIRLRDVALPVPAPTEVRVAVRATTVNRTDCAILRARPFLMRFVVGFARPRRPVLGTDFAGEVEAVGAEVTRFVPGDRVFGFEDDGASTQAEYCCIEAEASIARIPDGVDFETAAASIEGAHYAINFLNKVDLAPGADVLVNGATGAIGSALLQFAKLAAARVVAVCRAEHFDVVRSLGADAVLDYEHEAYSAGAPESYDFDEGPDDIDLAA
ncbi:MAG TPA: NAD(P)-dependent alcohol dehydrogenase [Planctomycetota bacterium]|nr:NAD(P)-dependent alcohol dehydrogenase [Planctomycetota bacterium]